METGLRGKVALITGAGSGIGRATALALAAEGAHVIVAELNAASAEETVALVCGRDGAARFVRCDVTDEGSLAAAVQSALDTEGQLDVMVNNAGIAHQPAPLINADAADWDRVFAVNLRGVFLGIKHAARAMIAGGRGGSIVNIASVAGTGASPMLGAYGATKAGVVQLTQTAALELARAGVRVNAVCPGWTETPILGQAERASLVAQVPAGRIGQPEEIAQMVVYLASDAATFVTGSAMRIDGGMRS
ncbi:MAG TPA: SDR family NAD(P)-dependent oxidoreductase [Roseiflexaceae bacterium]|nr:SDR family NAD(P)-dependent oxidoreductase [Roseiflexaceae bacterium]